MLTPVRFWQTVTFFDNFAAFSSYLRRFLSAFSFFFSALSAVRFALTAAAASFLSSRSSSSFRAAPYVRCFVGSPGTLPCFSIKFLWDPLDSPLWEQLHAVEEDTPGEISPTMAAVVSFSIKSLRTCWFRTAADIDLSQKSSRPSAQTSSSVFLVLPFFANSQTASSSLLNPLTNRKSCGHMPMFVNDVRTSLGLISLIAERADINLTCTHLLFKKPALIKVSRDLLTPLAMRLLIVWSHGCRKCDVLAGALTTIILFFSTSLSQDKPLREEWPSNVNSTCFSAGVSFLINAFICLIKVGIISIVIDPFSEQIITPSFGNHRGRVKRSRKEVLSSLWVCGGATSVQDSIWCFPATIKKGGVVLLDADDASTAVTWPPVPELAGLFWKPDEFPSELQTTFCFSPYTQSIAVSSMLRNKSASVAV